jgi:hypothetical protein
MYEVLDDIAAQTILTIESGDSIRRVSQAFTSRMKRFVRPSTVSKMQAM